MSSLETLSICQILGKVLRHGQYFMVYPSGFLGRPRDVLSPKQWKLLYEDLVLPTPDGATLCCYFFRAMDRPLQPDTLPFGNCTNERIEGASKVHATVIIFHGNGMNLGDYMFPAHELRRGGYNVLIVSYRGYAHSSGSPSETGLRIDAQTVLDYVTSHLTLSRLPIILYGHSLGGAVAIDLASRNPSEIHALIVENTFTSLPDIVRGWPICRCLAYFCHQKWNSAAKIHLIPATTPILMVRGCRDRVVPKKHMDTLWQLRTARGSPKGKENQESSAIPMPTKDRFHRVLNGYHWNTFMQMEFWDGPGGVWEFLSSLRDTASHDVDVSEAEAVPPAASGSHE